MALINNLTSWAAREAEELVAKNGISIERAIEQIADKYGQKAFQTTSKSAIEEFPTAPSKFLGQRSEAQNRSLRETIAPNVEESITARETSRYQEPVVTRDLVPVGERGLALPASKIQAPVRKQGERLSLPAGQEMMALPPGRKFPARSETSASEDFEASLENLDTGIYPTVNMPSAKQVAGAGAAGLGLSQALRSDVRGSETKESTISSPQEVEKLSTPELKKKTGEALKEADKQIKQAGGSTSKTATASEQTADTSEKTTPLDRFKQERDRLYDMYEKAETRNQWLEVAQLLGQAFTQYAAAQTGMRSGRPIAGFQIPSIDYGARTEREGRMLERRLRDISEEQEREQRLADRLRTEKQDTERLGLERRRVELAEREARTPKESTEDREIRRETRRGLQKKLDEQEQSLQKAIGAQQVIISGDISKKQKEKAQETLLTEAAAAGVDLEQVIAKSQVPGTIYGTNTDQNLVLTNLKAALADLQKRKQGGAVSETPVTSAPKQDSQILNYAKQYNLDYNQARNILIKRGYTPKE